MYVGTISITNFSKIVNGFLFYILAYFFFFLAQLKYSKKNIEKNISSNRND